MIGLVLVTHGRLATEFITAMEHVVGPQEAIEGTELQQVAARTAVSDARTEARALRTALVRATGTPSAGHIQRVLQLERHRDELERASVNLGMLRDELLEAAARARANAAAQAALPASGDRVAPEVVADVLPVGPARSGRGLPPPVASAGDRAGPGAGDRPGPTGE